MEKPFKVYHLEKADLVFISREVCSYVHCRIRGDRCKAEHLKLSIGLDVSNNTKIEKTFNTKRFLQKITEEFAEGKYKDTEALSKAIRYFISRYKFDRCFSLGSRDVNNALLPSEHIILQNTRLKKIAGKVTFVAEFKNTATGEVGTLSVGSELTDMPETVRDSIKEQVLAHLFEKRTIPERDDLRKFVKDLFAEYRERNGGYIKTRRAQKGMAELFPIKCKPCGALYIHGPYLRKDKGYKMEYVEFKVSPTDAAKDQFYSVRRSIGLTREQLTDPRNRAMAEKRIAEVETALSEKIEHYYPHVPPALESTPSGNRKTLIHGKDLKTIDNIQEALPSFRRRYVEDNPDISLPRP